MCACGGYNFYNYMTRVCEPRRQSFNTKNSYDGAAEEQNGIGVFDTHCQSTLITHTMLEIVASPTFHTYALIV